MIEAPRAGNIKFVAVARISDKVIIASYAAVKGDYNIEQYQSAINEVLGAPDFERKVTAGSRYRLVGDINAFNFTTDGQRIYVVITVTDYPERLVFPMINDFIPQFRAAHEEKSLICVADALSSKCQRMIGKLVDDYDNPGKKDKVSQVQQQVNDVKTTMHKNIDGMLRNLDKSSKIEEDTKRLQDQASKFDSQARTLKNRERWKSIKLSIAIGLVILIILIVIIVSFLPPSTGQPAVTNSPTQMPV